MMYTHVSVAPAWPRRSTHRPVASEPFHVITAPARTTPGAVVIAIVAAPEKMRVPASDSATGASVTPSTCRPAESLPTVNAGEPAESQTPIALAAKAIDSKGAVRWRRIARRNALVCRCAGANPPRGMGRVCGARSREPMPMRSVTAISDIHDAATDDLDRINGDVHRCS
jgi:hypothetical protein